MTLMLTWTRTLTDSLQKDTTYSDPNSLSLKDTGGDGGGGGHQLEMPESTMHWAPVTLSLYKVHIE